MCMGVSFAISLTSGDAWLSSKTGTGQPLSAQERPKLID